MKYFNKLSFTLFCGHLIIVFAVYMQKFEGSWGGFFYFDFPISMISFLPIGWNQWFFFGLIGSVWWYFLGIIFLRLFKK
jgi:hypothetical protein